MIELFRAVSKMGHAEEGNIHARFAAWRISAMAIKISPLESAWGSALACCNFGKKKERLRKVMWCAE